ncbi:MAG: acyl-CoA desaturase [Calothrix sp. C42_A2020_038]|nr:acyl-CoA desaturase [Calothrix sp. C42_A2020_038]
MTQTKTKVTYTKNIGFRKKLNQKVDDYFESNHIAKRDNLAMYGKTVLILGWVIGAWTFIIFGQSGLWIKSIACIVLGLGIAAIGFSVGHDANHGGYSNHKSVNYLIGLIYDVAGISSFLWRFRHNYLHHTYTNILDHDVDIYGDGLVRMTPYLERRWYHKFQHIYVNFIYMLLPFYWSFGDIQIILFKRKYHNHIIPIKVKDIFILLTGKVVWLWLFIGLPILLGYAPIQVIIGFSIVYMTHGVMVGNVFSLAHVLEPAQFIEPHPQSNQVDDEWAITQIKTTVDFAPKNALINWYVGGLNYQVVHHLFPNICHIHYPKIAPIIAEVCAEFNIQYNVYPSLLEALVANYRFLKSLGSDNEANLNLINS